MPDNRTSSTASITSTGLGLSSVLTIVFVVLKLTHVIDWSWWWVLSPTLIGVGAAVLILLGALILVLVHDKD